MPNSHLASPGVPNAQNVYAHSHKSTAQEIPSQLHSTRAPTRSPTHTSTGYMTAVATSPARLSRHALELVQSEMIKENWTLRRCCMEHVHVLISEKVITSPSVRPPPRPTKTTRGTQKRSGRGTNGKKPNSCLEFYSDHPVYI